MLGAELIKSLKICVCKTVPFVSDFQSRKLGRAANKLVSARFRDPGTKQAPKFPRLQNMYTKISLVIDSAMVNALIMNRKLVLLNC